MDLILLMSPPQGGEGGGGGSGLLGFLPLVLIFLIFYLLVLRPHSKRQKDLAKMVSSLKQGDRVLTSGGLFGTVVTQKEDGNVFVIKIAEQVRVEVAKSAIATVVKEAKEG
jgi:preprotein translocase subunit YajC